MGRVVAIGGGDLQTTDAINAYTVKLTGVEKPNVLFVGTASMDNEGYFGRVKTTFQKWDCVVHELALTRESYSDEEINDILKWADVIYIGGGDSRTMIEIWKKHSLDHKLLQVYENDSAVLTGISAGAACWFRGCHSDAEYFEGKDDWHYIMLDGLMGLYPYVVCPHYNEDGRDSFDQMFSSSHYPGIALDNDTAFVDINGEHYFVKSNDDARVWKLIATNGKYWKTELEAKRI